MEWMAEGLTQLGVVALPLACVLASEATGASMFIAAFVAGLAAQAGYRDVGRHSVEFTEEWGQPPTTCPAALTPCARLHGPPSAPTSRTAPVGSTRNARSRLRASMT